MKFKKYIITKVPRSNDINFKCGYVELHCHLATPQEYASSRDLILGGGMFEIDKDAKEIKLYGKSTDFGSVDNLEEILAKNYDKVMEELKDFYYFVQSHGTEEIDTNEFTLVSMDELGFTHVIKKK